MSSFPIFVTAVSNTKTRRNIGGVSVQFEVFAGTKANSNPFANITIERTHSFAGTSEYVLLVDGLVVKQAVLTPKGEFICAGLEG